MVVQRVAEDMYCPVSDWNNPSDEPSIFAGLTMEEYLIVEAFLENQEELNITHSADATRLDENIIFWVEWYYPIKQEALDYLDHDGPNPGRWARAAIYRGSVPDVVEYKVSNEDRTYDSFI